MPGAVEGQHSQPDAKQQQLRSDRGWAMDRPGGPAGSLCFEDPWKNGKFSSGKF